MLLFSVRLIDKLYSRSNCLLRNCAIGLVKLSTNISMENVESSLKVKLSERLSQLVKPVNYNLKLNPNLVTGTFQGSVNIHVNFLEQRKYLQLHTHLLDIKNVKVSKAGKDIPVAKFMEVKQIEQLLIHFEDIVEAGHYHVNIEFSGSLTKSIVGFYASRVKDRTMVASKFEPTYARQAFPCFDEPEFKATFDIALVKPASYRALSNMNEINKVRDEVSDTDIVFFATSVPMSTYLACFVICDFDYKQTEINAKGVGNNFTLRSFAQKEEMHKIYFAQDIGQRATEFYIQYYEVPFPLPKLDMIAIPDYQSGATEHWGLITYRETSFLIDEATASITNKISAANTIAHELAHMWFGNLVTMKWWDELWLNEGFASYMQAKCLDHIEPSWTMLDMFLTKTMHPVLVTDAKLSSHSIVQNVSTPDEITAIFDSISYQKGASILRMLEGFVGENNFRKGVSDYLKKYEYGNTITPNFLNSLEPYFKAENPDFDLSHIMDTWTRQQGYPVVTVKPGNQPNSYVLTQSRFLLDPEASYPCDSSYKYRWVIPITYKSSQGASKTVTWFPDIDDNVIITLPEGHSWLKINNNQVGFYRVKYSEEMWRQLIQQIKERNSQLTISDRSHLQDDIFALASSGHVSYDIALELLGYLTVEEDYVPWNTANSIFNDLKSKLLNSSAYDDLQRFIQHLVKPIYDKQSWDRKNHSIIEGLLRVQILSIATRCMLPEAVSQVRTMFLNWLDSHGTKQAFKIEPDLREIVYHGGMTSATKEEWEKLWQIYLHESDAHEKVKLSIALAAPNDTEILKRYLSLAWEEKHVRGQDYINVLHYIASNPSGTALIWDHVRNDWPRLVNRFSLNSRYLGRSVPGVTKTFATVDKLNEMQSFFTQYPEAGAGYTSRLEALENVKNKIKWTEHNGPSIEIWLKNYVSNLSS